MDILGIMGAMPEEVEQITRALLEHRTERYAGVDYHIGRRSGKTLVVCCAGMGKVNAASTAQALISHFGVQGIIFSGIGGNMCTEVGIGDVVIGTELVYHDADLRMIAQSAPGTRSYTADPALVNAIQTACDRLEVHNVTGRIATGDQFVGDAETKICIQNQCNPKAVDMEGAAVGHVSMRNSVPFVVLRAMSDNCSDSIESLGAESFDVGEYVTTASAIVVAAVDAL